MRVLIALPDTALSRLIKDELENRFFYVEVVSDGNELLQRACVFDLLIVHCCLPVMDGWQACEKLAAHPPVNPPKILYLCPAEMRNQKPFWADCTAETGVSVSRLCDLVQVIEKKPLSRLAAAQQEKIISLIENFLNEIAMKPSFKGRTYAAWLLERMVPSPHWSDQSLNLCYEACAQAFSVTAVSVERCLRIAVESVFTQGSMQGIERYFGATVDPERGKPTNRAFLAQAVQQLRLIP